MEQKRKKKQKKEKRFVGRWLIGSSFFCLIISGTMVLKKTVSPTEIERNRWSPIDGIADR